ncbi:MAG TPA: thiamine pyrophosphate-dependent enzyme, partial [Dehalococcoidales bacterium]|nr:thiamine pyrophosphate-dependent enzyme [Dehalococcoidales bacterium]
ILKRGKKAPKYINCRHEVAAISAAQGYTEVTGKLPVVLLHSSVGLLMGAMAMRNAVSARAPMLILSGETCEHCGDEDVKPQGWQWLGLLSDNGGTANLVRDFVKWSNAVRNRDTLADAVTRGSRIALESPRGPVYISVPPEILARSGSTLKIAPVDVTKNVPDEAGLKKVAAILAKSKAPIIIADHAGRKAEGALALTRLAEFIGAPVFDTMLHFSANISRQNPLWQSALAPEALKEADTVFVVASSVPWYPPKTGPRDDAKVILLAEDTRHENWPYWNYRFDVAIDSDVPAGLEALVRLAREQKRKPDAERVANWGRKHDALIVSLDKDAHAVKVGKPIAARWLMHVAQKTLPPDAIILDETILHTHILHRYLAEPGRYIKPAYGGLGVGIGAALGVKLGKPERPVVLFVGDGAFNYNPVLAALGLSAEYKIPIMIVLLDNGGYIAMSRGYQGKYPGLLGVDIKPTPDYAKAAEACGAYAEKVELPDKIGAALKRGLKEISSGRTALLDVIIEANLNP